MTEVRTAQRRELWSKMRPRGGRAARSPITMWFFDIDRMLLLLALLLIAIGLLAVAAASPAAAVRLAEAGGRYPPLYFFWRQLMWVSVSVPLMIAVSMTPVALARRMALVGAVVFFAALALVPFIGVVHNNARRWIDLGVSEFQPSEFLKPCFVVALAWLLSLREKEPDLPVVTMSFILTGSIACLLMLQPDFGQTVMFGLLWFALLLISGVPMRTLGALLAAAPAGLLAAYLFYDTARNRINAFIFRGTDESPIDHYQTDRAHETITAGGVMGTGPGGGTMKFKLPEGHTDYIFSVIGEEFGLVACALIALLFLAIIARVFVRLLDEADAFRVLAAGGLATQFGVQALISMAVNTGLAPAKGMTLPFISYGGSSMIALSFGMGLLLAFTRRNPFLSRSPYVVSWSKL